MDSVNVATAMEQVDGEFIIIEVGKFSCIYNIKVPDYKSKNVKTQVWKSVFKSGMEELWDYMSKDNQYEICKFVES